MKSTGEVMGLDSTMGLAYAKAQMAAQPSLPDKGNLFISVKEGDKAQIGVVAKEFADLGFKLYATSGTAQALREAGLEVTRLFKISEGRPNALDMIKNGELQLIINTPAGKSPRADEIRIRSTAAANRLPIMTTLRAARASAEGIRAMRESGLQVRTVQEYQAELKGR
jgi:carbamoyl-phosphate synthase large subunit